MARRASFDLRLALLLLIVAALNLPYLPDRVVPVHDTFYNFANFHIFYSELFFHGDLPRWYPYGTFGLPSDFEQAASLSPFSYLAGLAGWLLGVRDALLLFKLAALGEQLAFVFGVYVLARRLFPTPDTALLLGLAAAGSVVWTVQQWWDLRLYALLPLVLFFVVRFLETRRPVELWLAGITGVAWALGTTPYAVPLQALVVLGFALVAGGRELPRALASLASPTRANLIGLGTFLAAAIAWIWFVSHALDHTSLHAPDRDPLTGTVDLATFRSYGGNANLVVVLNSLLFGWPLRFQWGSSGDNSFYFGLLPVAGLAIALARERSRPFLGLVLTAVALIALSLGGAFATLVYYVPGMGYFRHVGLVYGLVKALLLVAAGYGIERLWALGPPRFSHPVLRVVGALFLLEAVVAAPRLFEPMGPDHWIRSWGSHVLLRLVAYGSLLGAARLSALPWRGALVAALALDLGLFQLAVYRDWEKALSVRDTSLLEAVQVREPYYQPTRVRKPGEAARPEAQSPEQAQSQRALALNTRRGPKQVYWYAYQFSNLDPCRSEYRTDYLPAGVDRLLSLARRQALDVDAILGCGTPKLRLASAARTVDGTAEAEQALLAALRRGGERATVIEGAAGAPTPAERDAGGSAAGTVAVRGFTLGSLRAEVQVDAPQGAWLVYADANHPGWRASVNGSETPVHPADLAFKAVRVPPGASQVELWFDHGLNGILRYGLAGLGVAWAAGLLAWIGAALVRGRTST